MTTSSLIVIDARLNTECLRHSCFNLPPGRCVAQEDDSNSHSEATQDGSLMRIFGALSRLVQERLGHLINVAF